MRISKVRNNKIETIYNPTNVVYEPENKKITVNNGTDTLTAEYTSEEEAKRFYKDVVFALTSGIEASAI